MQEETFSSLEAYAQTLITPSSRSCSRSRKKFSNRRKNTINTQRADLQ